MFFPPKYPWVQGESLGEHLERCGVSRREFLEFCGGMAAVLGISSLLTPRIARALAQQKRPSVIWLSLQECTGCGAAGRGRQRGPRVTRPEPGEGAVRIGTVIGERPGMVVLRTGLGGSRVVDMLPGDQLPRICQAPGRRIT